MAWAMTGVRVAIAVAVAMLGRLVGGDVPVELFYLAPIGLSVWFGGRSTGVALALVCAAAPVFADWWSNPEGFGPNSPFLSAAIRLAALLAVAIVLWRILDALRRETALAHTDVLTGAANRRSFFEALGVEIQRVRRTGSPLTLAYIDLDNFKYVNDTFGHKAGDSVLRLIVEIKQKHARVVDTIARLGGDEFALLMPETDHDGAMAGLEHLRDVLLDAMKTRHFPVTFSIGVVTYYTPPSDPDEIVGKADSLMYAVKEAGKADIISEVIGEPAIARSSE